MIRNDINDIFGGHIKLSALEEKSLSQEEILNYMYGSGISEMTRMEGEELLFKKDNTATYELRSEATKINVLEKQSIPQDYNVINKRKTTTNFISLQSWEGCVTKVENIGFTARLYDITNEGTEEEAEFTYDDITDDDKKLVKEGAIFYWNLGYEDAKGTRKRCSIIKFRRLANWPKDYLNKLSENSKNLRNKFNWE